MQHAGSSAGVALKHETEHRHEHQQQREQRDEAVVGDQRGKLSRLIVAELLDHRGDEAEAGALLLAAIERAQAIGEAHWEGGLRIAAVDILKEKLS